jgi:nicotinamide-nucleotide amidase
MRILVLSIGDELLLGDTINTNAAAMGRMLVEEGLRLSQEQMISDDASRIYQVLNDAWGQWDVVVTTGGLGPTHDDRTMDVLERFCENYNLTMKEYENAFGVEKGVLVEGEKTWLMALPGVPYEAEGMFKTIVLPKILAEAQQERTLTPRFIMTAGEREKDLANEFIGDWSYFERNEALDLLDEFEVFVRERVSFCTYGTKSTDSLSNVVLGLCREKGWRLGAAESCTGGMIGASLTDPAGASDVFMGSLVTYSNEAKISQLGVKTETLTQYGAVSKQTVLEMAEGVRKALDVEVGCSISGIAGPGGGTEEKPVGTIWFGLSTPNETFAWTTKVAHTRELNRSRSVILTLEALRRTLLGETRLPRGVQKQV